jgi:ankyrin repeat protein
MVPEDVRTTFVRNALWHGSLDDAATILEQHPQLASADIHIAAILGDDVAVREFIARDPASVSAKSAPYGGDALNYLGLSKYLRLERSRTPAFVRAATALLDAGADPNTGFWTTGSFPEHETALYGASGVAHNPELSALLIERGADPNDGEVTYHTPESYDNRCIELLVQTGKLTSESLGVMLIRKLDWHDIDGLKYLLEHGAPADGERGRGWHALHHALARSNGLEMLKLLLDHRADPFTAGNGLTAISRAAREGRGDVLEEFARRGISIELAGVDRLIAACATANGDPSAVRALAAREPALEREVHAMGGTLIAKFAGNGNLEGVRALLDLSVSASAPFAEGDPYFGVPKGSLAIHVAAWRAYPSIVRLLIERGSPVNLQNANGDTPLMLAVRACVDSYWAARRSPDSAVALLAAGASTAGIKYPTGYAELDAVLKQRM